MGLSPYTTTLASGASDGINLVETFVVPTRGRSGVILIHDVTAIGVAHAQFLTDDTITFPVVIDGTHDQFEYNEVEFKIAHASYPGINGLAAAVNAAVSQADATALSAVVTCVADPAGTNALLFTSVPSGVSTLAFGTGAANDCSTLIGLEDGDALANGDTDGDYSVTIKIQGKDAASGKFYDILTSAVQEDTSTRVLQVHPVMAAVTNLVATSQLPETIRIVVTHDSLTSITRTLGLQLTSSI